MTSLMKEKWAGFAEYASLNGSRQELLGEKTNIGALY
jgi:hypothetical protein